jgi:hypothetical protein
MEAVMVFGSTAMPRFQLGVKKRYHERMAKSTDITIEQLDEFLATAYDAARAAASDGKVYKRGSYGDTKLGAEITEPYKCTGSKPLADWSCVYKHDGLWYSITVRHARQDEKFKKEYPGNYCGFAIIVTEYFIDE